MAILVLPRGPALAPLWGPGVATTTVLVLPQGPALAPLWGPGVATTTVSAGRAALLAALWRPPFRRAALRSHSHDAMHLIVVTCQLAEDVLSRLPADWALGFYAGPVLYARKTEAVLAPDHVGFVVDGVQADWAL